MNATEIGDDGMCEFSLGTVTQAVDVLDVYYRLTALQYVADDLKPEQIAAADAVYLRAIRDEILPELGFPGASLTAAKNFSRLITDLVRDVKKNSEEVPTSNDFDAPASSAAE